jgi:transforming growth factor-beta-induced protein
MKKPNLILTLALLTGLFVFTSCEKEEDPITEEGTPEEYSIAEFASSNENFSILVEALVKTDLVSTLSGSGDFTAFAPDNNAFNNLFMELGVSGVQDIPAEDLKPILLYHVLGESLTSGMITDGYYSSLSPAQGRTVSMYIGTTDGVIHAIDAVILPPSIVDIAAQNEDFETLVSAVVGADLAGTLSDASGTFTVFAPTDDAFAALGTDVPSDLTPILLYHVLGSPVFSDEISSGIISSLNATDPEIVVEVSDMGVMLNGSAKVIATDIVGTNGVIHGH